MEEALMLLGIGMTTVFVTLIMVVVVGTVIIRFVNAYVPAVEVTKARQQQPNNQEIASNKMAAIVTAIDIVTQGKGKVTNIQKV